MFSVLAFSGRLCRKNTVVPAVFIVISKGGKRQDFFVSFGKRGWLNMTRWRELHGGGKVSTAQWPKRRQRRNQLDPIQLIGEKNGTKRHILVDERGFPLSIVVTGANRHDVTQVDEVLKNRIRKPRGASSNIFARMLGTPEKNQKKTMRNYRYIPHIRPRCEEKIAIQNGCKAKRWIVEVAHSWFNRFRKLLVRYEKSNSSFEALLHLAATIIIYRKLAVI